MSRSGCVVLCLSLSLAACSACSNADGGASENNQPKPKPDLGLDDTEGPDAIDDDFGPPIDATPPEDTMPALVDTGVSDSGAPEVPDDATGDADGGLACHPVINELETGSTASGNDEFIEIYNPCKKSINLNGWKIVYRAEKNLNAVSGPDTSTLHTIGAFTVVAGGYYVVANASGAFASAPYKTEGTFGGGLPAAVGSVGLRDVTGALVDSVFWGTPAGGFHAFIETKEVKEPPTTAMPGYSLYRSPNGFDSDDNSADFKSGTPPTPHAKNP